jgi:hypothetical protein
MAGDSIDVVARIYHTENGHAHAEGETYAVTDPILAETLYGCGFVTIAGWTPPPPIDPPALGRREPPGLPPGPERGRGR